MRDSHPAARRPRGAPHISVFNAVATYARALALLALAMFCIGAAAPAQAHGRLGAAEGRCRLFIGPDVMNFTGYLPEASKNEFCEDIPATGPMIMVLDAEQEELRDMFVEVRIVKDVGADKENENLEAVTVAHQPPKIYRTGTVNFEHTFDEPGYFVGIVTVTGNHGERWMSRFPFSVGKTFMRDLPVYLMLAFGVIAAFVIYLLHRNQQPPPALVTAASAFKPPPDLPRDPPSTGGDAYRGAKDDAAPGAEADAPAPRISEPKAPEPNAPEPKDEAEKPDGASEDGFRREAAE